MDDDDDSSVLDSEPEAKTTCRCSDIHPPSKLSHNSWKCRSLFSFSCGFCCTLFICFIVCLYMFAGAVVLLHIETSYAPKTISPECERTLEQIIDYLWNRSRRLTKDSWKKLALKNYAKETECKYYYRVGKSIDTPSPQTFTASFYCVFSAVTTIGWGNIAPVSENGRMFLIFYSFFGIPLMLILLSRLQKLWKYILKYFSIRFRGCCSLCRKVHLDDLQGPCCLQCARSALLSDHEWMPKLYHLLLILMMYSMLGAYYFFTDEGDWSFSTRIYLLFACFSTIGFGDVVPDLTKFFPVLAIYILIGLALLAIIFDVLQNYLDGMCQIFHFNFRKSNLPCISCMAMENKCSDVIRKYA